MEIRRRDLLLGLMACALGPFSRMVQAQGRRSAGKKIETIWTGQSGGYAWKWTTANLTAATGSQAGRAAFSAERMERKAAGSEINDVQTYFECDIMPLSIVGSLVCYQRDYYWEGGAHPSGAITYVTRDVSRPNRPLKLTDLFPDATVLKALLTDPVIQKVMQREKIAAPATSAALVEKLKFQLFGGENDSMYGFSEDLLSGFAFHHLDLKSGQVAVRLNVSWGAEVFRFQTTQIGLLLPIPERLRTALIKADSGEQGFLMKDAKRLAKDRTTLLFSTGRKP